MSSLVLGIESSCDETAAAVVQNGREILSNQIHSQISLHQRFHGIVPEIASRSHLQRILPIIRSALAEADCRVQDLDAIAVTHRPGMIGSLLVGLSAAKSLALFFDKPLIGVDHIQAHLHAAFMCEPDLPLPCLALVASGGHTALYRMDAVARSERIGRTRDDAAGEALDKAAALVGLPYPGGPSIQEAARSGKAESLSLPRPMLGPDSLDFSFSGLKTALLYHLRGSGLTRPMPELTEAEVADLAAAYQAAVVDILVKKLRRAADQHPFASLAIGGGVARNELLRERLRADSALSGLKQVFPQPALCSDNGAMIAGLGHELWRSGVRSDLELDALATGQTGR
ncbi:MAG: tRNA (adenosine(37)-N6)-threonylcarbamoyltransferase complex transferase subunit TsaD [Planctomycetota bacterium]|jgi:N6-L-threonylcarbamoyladenine synthase